MKLNPLADRVILKQNAAEVKTAGGIFLTQSAQEKPEIYEQAIEKATKEYDIFRVRQDQEYVSEFDKQTEKYFKGE